MWALAALLSREPAVSEIAGTNISIARYPAFGVDLSKFDRVFDLTAEFPVCYQRIPGYECVANLDGICLRQTEGWDVGAGESVLVHCALGHGRSATFTALLLVKLGLFSSAESAYRAVLRARPRATVGRAQWRQIQNR